MTRKAHPAVLYALLAVAIILALLFAPTRAAHAADDRLPLLTGGPPACTIWRSSTTNRCSTL